MNAGGVHNTFKSNGLRSGVSSEAKLQKLVADG